MMDYKILDQNSHEYVNTTNFSKNFKLMVLKKFQKNILLKNKLNLVKIYDSFKKLTKKEINYLGKKHSRIGKTVILDIEYAKKEIKYLSDTLSFDNNCSFIFKKFTNFNSWEYKKSMEKISEIRKTVNNQINSLNYKIKNDKINCIDDFSWKNKLKNVNKNNNHPNFSKKLNKCKNKSNDKSIDHKKSKNSLKG